MLHVFTLLAALVQTIAAPPTPVPSPTVSPMPTPVVSPSPTPVVSPTPPSVPALSATPGTVVMGRGQSVTVAIANASGTIVAMLQHALVAVAVDQSTDTITLTAAPMNVLGADVLHVTDQSGAAIDVPVRVALPAATIPATASLTVTGTPADPAWLAQQIVSLARAVTAVQPGLQAAIASPSPAPLAPGESAQYAVPVQVAGDGLYVPVASTISVSVQNQSIDGFVPVLLFYDDDPERLTATGVLYRGDVTIDAPVRLYYYHDADAGAYQLAVLAEADSQDPTQMQSVASTAGPNADVMSVGHGASKNYLLYKPLDLGTIVDVPQDAPLPLIDTPLAGGQGVAGVVDLRVLQGGPVRITVLSAPAGATLPQLQAMEDGPLLSGDGHHRTGVFVPASAPLRAAYTAGGPDAAVQYGAQSPAAASATAVGHDVGDYGVLQTIEFTLSNPTDAPATAYLYEKPLGGVVRSSFLAGGTLQNGVLAGGTLYEAGCARLPQEYQVGLNGQITAYRLDPGQTYGLTVQTMTDGGSNYPIEVGITGTPPPPAPAMSAPDGCFPKP